MSDLTTGKLDRYTQISELGDVMRNMLRPGIPVILILVGLMTAKLFFTDQSGWLGLLWMGAGTGFALAIWRDQGVGLPLLPMFALQHLAVYGLPIFTRNEIIVAYDDSLITQSGLEIGIFLAAAAFAWRGGMQVFIPKRGYSYMLRIFTTGGSRTLRIFALGLIICTTTHELLFMMRLLDNIYLMLPAGSWSIMSAILNSAAMSGYFLTAMSIGTGTANGTTRTTFWICLITSCLLMASSFLLSSTTNLVGAVTIGLFWGSGRVPWRFLGVTVIILSFLHVGKFEMRERYWQKGQDDVLQQFNLGDMFPHYVEWIDSSYNILTASEDEIAQRETTGKGKSQSMLNRVNNLQNLLFVVDAVNNKNIPTLGGETYVIIPPLLIPRVLWPEKPRTHEGQIMLNTHYGRQTLRDSYLTYIAWGLVPEAYGNFGPYLGVIILGIFCGFIFAWLEVVTAFKPLLSLEGLLTFALFIGIAASFEMVASVLITSLFQSMVTIAAASMPFVHRTFSEKEELETEDPA